MPDLHANFVHAQVVAPSPGSSGTSLKITAGRGTWFPNAPYNVIVAPDGEDATPENAEVVRVTSRAVDTLTVVREQEGSDARSIQVGDRVYLAPTKKWFDDIEGDLAAHLADSSDAHDASAISFSPGGTVAATDAQAAIAEVASEADARLDSVETARAPFDIANEVNPDGVTLVTTDLQNVFDTYAGERPVLVRADAAFAFDDRITIPDGTHLVFERGGRLVVSGTDAGAGTAMLYGAGTEGTKVALDANVAAGASSVTLPAGQAAAFTAGDLIAFECSTITAGSTGRSREMRMVTKVVGAAVQLDKPLHFAYTTAATGELSKIIPLRDVRIDGLEMGISGLTPGTDMSYALRLQRTLNARIDGIALRNMIGGVVLVDCYDTTIDDLKVDRLRSFADSYGYGLAAVGATTGLTVNGLSGRDCRHVFTTLADERSGGTFWGGPQDVQINQGVGYAGADSFSVWDTHEFGRDIHLNDCIAVGGGATANGYQVRAKHVQLNNCRSVRAGLRAIYQSPDADDLEVFGGVFALAQGAGGAVALSGLNGSIRGATVRDSVSAGVVVAGTDNLVAGCRIVGNQYGVQDSGATRPTIKDNFIPQSAAQTVSLLNLGATARATDNDLPGYTSNGISGANAAARIDRNMTTQSVQTSVTAAATITPPANESKFILGGATQVNNVTATWAGDERTIQFAGSTTIGAFGNIYLAGGVAFAGTIQDELTLVCDGVNWREKCRSVN